MFPALAEWHNYQLATVLNASLPNLPICRLANSTLLTGGEKWDSRKQGLHWKKENKEMRQKEDAGVQPK